MPPSTGGTDACRLCACARACVCGGGGGVVQRLCSTMREGRIVACGGEGGALQCSHSLWISLNSTFESFHTTCKLFDELLRPPDTLAEIKLVTV
jgi:ubiquitin